jgi:hypothetical protein
MSGGRARDPWARDNVRADWFLREHGRFPTVDELVAIRQHERDAAADVRLAP